MTMSYENNGAVSSSTKSSEIRKIRKPLMEKKRRARINSSLNELKRILLEYSSILKEGSRPTKLEKADILELTVRHLQNLHQRIETNPEGRFGGSQKDRIQQTTSVRYPALNFLCCSGCEDEDEMERRREKTVGVDQSNDAAENPCARMKDTRVTCSSSQLSHPTQERMRRPAAKEGSPKDLVACCSVWRPWQGLPGRDSIL